MEGGHNAGGEKKASTQAGRLSSKEATVCPGCMLHRTNICETQSKGKMSLSNVHNQGMLE